uniref:Uncharacterized protein n=1 Tax=Chromera velia CCMP2878 TaxID=1169474 RepID=A0A0G4HJA9_9ALVE|eukprot:Cvel_7065.t1-p1 / transcript=Cvel_7065.t1 / gene=Cvel_7065 / organism=Chromera_velia_CCMP2878 / gene_product=Keratin-associated protein 16-1, putative / transcript_product=Keratin-associated protein 16-1, putative / location=Cvel_scaffold361:48300-54019(+) / protein_length=1048 / sequence_SO=supercontig / SO=protein_coding / is_pseudo=false
MQSYELVHTRSGVEWNRGQSFRDTRGMTLRFSDPKQLRELQKSRDVQFHIQQDAYGLYILSHFEPVQDYYIHPLRVKVFCVFLVLFQLFALVVMTPGAFSLDKDYRLISRGVRYEWFPFSGIPAHMVFLADQIYHAPPLMHVIEALAMMTLVFQVVTESRGHLRCLILSSLREEDALGGGSKQGGQEVTPLGRHRSSFEYFEDASPVHPSRSRFPSGMDEEEGEGEGGKETMEGWREIWGRRLASLFRIFFVGFLGCFVMPFCLVVCGLTLILQSKTEGEALLNGFKVLFIAEQPLCLDVPKAAFVPSCSESSLCALMFRKQPLCLHVPKAAFVPSCSESSLSAFMFRKQPLCLDVPKAAFVPSCSESSLCAFMFRKQPLCLHVPKAAFVPSCPESSLSALMFRKQPLCLDVPKAAFVPSCSESSLCALMFRKQPLCLHVPKAAFVPSCSESSLCAFMFRKQPLCLHIPKAAFVPSCSESSLCAFMFRKQPLCLHVPKAAFVPSCPESSLCAFMSRKQPLCLHVLKAAFVPSCSESSLCALMFRKQPLCLHVPKAAFLPSCPESSLCALMFRKQPLCLDVPKAAFVPSCSESSLCAFMFRKQPLCLHVPKAAFVPSCSESSLCAFMFRKQPLCLHVPKAAFVPSCSESSLCAFMFRKQPLCLHVPKAAFVPSCSESSLCAFMSRKQPLCFHVPKAAFVPSCSESSLSAFMFRKQLDDYAVKFFQSLLPERSTTSKEKGGEQDDKWKYNKKRTQFRIVINRRAARLVASHLFELTLFFLPLTCGPILIPWFLFGLRKHALFIPAFKDLEYSHVLLDMAYVPLAVGAQGFAAATNLSLLYCFFGKNAAKGSADANDRGSIMGTSYAPTETVAGGVAGQGDEEEGCNTLVPLSSSHVEPVQPMKLEGDKGGDGTESEEAEEEREEEGVSSFFANTSPVRVLVMFCFGIWSSLFFLSAISRTAVLVHLLGWPLIGFYTFLLRHAIRLHQSGTGFVRLESYYVFFVVGFAVLNVFALIVALSTPQLAALLPPLDQYAMENAEGGTSAKVVKET